MTAACPPTHARRPAGWGALVLAERPPMLFEMPLVAVNRLEIDLANALIEQWGHNLGACLRPFHQEAFGLEVSRRIVAVAVSASIVSTTVNGFARNEVVELARQCADPSCSWANRVLIRLWRECCAQLWPCWPVKAAVSYSQNARHRGDLYRFDGWEKFTESAGSSGGGTWTAKRKSSDAVSGSKTGWMWRYE